MDLEYIIKDYFRSKNLQDFINRRFKDESSIILKKDKIEYISYGDNLHFSPRSYGKWYCVVEEMIYENTPHMRIFLQMISSSILGLMLEVSVYWQLRGQRTG